MKPADERVTAVEATIPVFKPYIDADTAKAAVDALELGWLGMGSYVNQFEQRLATYLELTDRYAVAVNTGTSALHLALLLAGVGPGDEVITPSFNNIADFQAIKAVGANPVFCDIRPDDLTIDVERAEALVGPRTRAVIGMDYAGVLCRLDELDALAQRHRLRVIHDAAHSLGTRHKGKRVGSFSDLAVFSFDPVKTITCIDGGALIVQSSDDVEALHRYRLLGMDQRASQMYTNQRAWTYDVAGAGFRYHLANLHASIGLSQLERLDEFITSRRHACQDYVRLLQGTPGLVLPATDYDGIAPFIFFVRVLDGKRDLLIAALKERGVDTGIHWIPGHNFSFLRDCRRGPLPVTDQVGSEILTLPLHSFMDTQTVERVATSVRAALAR